MKLLIWINGFFFVALILQVNISAGDDPKANLTALQEKVEKLIETVMVAIQEYYNQTEKEYKCLPERYTAEMMNAVKDGIECVEQSHRQFQEGRIDLQEHRKEFHECFVKARNSVEYVLENVDPAENNCPPDLVEKTFQINVTTSYTKTFNLNIQNGVDVVYNKTFQVTRMEEPCRNYPDVFSFDEKTSRNQLAAVPSSGILHHNLGSRSGTKHIVTGEVTTPRNSGPVHDGKISTSAGIGHLRQKQRKDEVAYAYFQEFHNSEETKKRQERSAEPEIRRKTRNPVLKDRQATVTV